MRALGNYFGFPEDDDEQLKKDHVQADTQVPNTQVLDTQVQPKEESSGDHAAESDEEGPEVRPLLSLTHVMHEESHVHRAEELAFVKRYQMPAQGELWYMIDSGWLHKWRMYMKHEGPYPGAITNWQLLSNERNLQEPKLRLQAGVHYRGVSPTVWKTLHEKYGGWPSIRCKKLDIYYAETADFDFEKFRTFGSAVAKVEESAAQDVREELVRRRSLSSGQARDIVEPPDDELVDISEPVASTELAEPEQLAKAAEMARARTGFSLAGARSMTNVASSVKKSAGARIAAALSGRKAKIQL